MKPQYPNLGILILAAGASRRLGRPKQLLKLEGQTLLRRMADLAVGLNVEPVVVVLGAQAERMRLELNDSQLHIVENRNWTEGMSTSLRIGIEYLETLKPALQAVLVILVDQPLVDEELLKTLLETYREQKPPLVAAFYGQVNGVPAIFDRSLFGELKAVQGDRGARRVIRKYEGELVSVPFPGGEWDVDTEEDYLRMKNEE